MIISNLKSYIKKNAIKILKLDQKKENDIFEDQKLVIPKAEIIFQVGVRDGYDTKKFIEQYPETKIYGFEPYNPLFNEYEKEFKDNQSIIPVNSALIDFKGEADYFVNQNGTNNSLQTAEKFENILYHGFDRQLKNKEVVKITTNTLDDYCSVNNINKIDILKIDLPGKEMACLKGAVKMLSSKAIALLSVQFKFIGLYTNQPNVQEIFSFFENNGYSLFNIYNLKKTNESLLWSGELVFVELNTLKKYVNRNVGYHSQIGQDKILDEELFKGKRDGFFVEVGAADGINFSNTLFFEKDRNWQGLCIEPNPNQFKKLQESGRKCLMENCAIYEKNEELEFLALEGYSQDLSGLTKTYHRKMKKRIEGDIKQRGSIKHFYKVKGVPLQQLFDKYNIKYVDYCSIDVEGAELSVLKSIDFKKTFIRCFSIEDNFGSKKEEKILLANGYKLWKKIEWDNIFIKDDKN